MAECVTGSQQIDRPALVGDFHRPRPHDEKVIQRLRAGGHDHGACGEVLDLDTAGQAGEVVSAERVKGRL